MTSRVFGTSKKLVFLQSHVENMKKHDKLLLNEEFLVSAIHQMVLTALLPFVHTVNWIEESNILGNIFRCISVNEQYLFYMLYILYRSWMHSEVTVYQNRKPIE